MTEMPAEVRQFDEVLAEVLQLEAAGRYQDMINLLLREPANKVALLCGLNHLLTHKRFASASRLGETLLDICEDHPLVHLARAIGGLITNNRELKAEATAMLERFCDALPPERRVAFYIQVLDPTMRHVIAPALGTNDPAAVLRGLEILKAGAPVLRHVFDWSAGDQLLPTSRDTWESLIAYRSPPQGAPRGARRTVVAVRGRFPDQTPASRLFDVGPRFADAVNRYGWPAIFYPMSWDPWNPSLASDFRAILDRCRKWNADVLIIDDHYIAYDTTHPLRRQMIASLRQALPGIRIVALHLDSWHIEPDFLRLTAQDVDAIWAPTPSLPLWRDPDFTDKLLLAPIVHGDNVRAPDPAAPMEISFVGGFMTYNWHRVFWRAAAVRDGLPITWQPSNHGADGMSALDGYAAYMRRLAESGCSINLAMRSDLSYVITDRSFEAPLVGALLVQEAAPDLDYFFVAGTHYLPFTTYADLCGIVELIQTQPERVRAIRRTGHEFAVARYADGKLIGYLDALLFHPVGGAAIRD